MYTILRYQLIIFIVLFLVFFSQKSIRIFGAVADGTIPKFLICVFFGLSLPEVIKLILPVSLFFGILITFNYLHTNHEIIAMYSCGLGYTFIVRGVLFLSVITTIFSMINVLFLSPLCLYYQNKIVFKYQFDFTSIRLFERKFHFVKNMNMMFFINGVYEKNFKDIFLIRVLSNGHSSVMVSDFGCIKKFFDGSQWFVLEFGNYYCWDRDIIHSNFYMSHFDKYNFLIGNQAHYYRCSNNSVAELSMLQLWRSSSIEAQVELHWRLTLVIIGFIMVMIIFPLSLMKLNHSYLLITFPSVVLYLIFFLLQIFLRANISKGSVSLIWIWIINVLYVFIAVILNFWDSALVRNIRWKVRLFFCNYDSD